MKIVTSAGEGETALHEGSNADDKKQSTDVSSLPLPEEVLVEILLRLPLESLIQTVRVCKRWRRLILDSEDFKRSHHGRWKSRLGIIFNTFTFFPNDNLIFTSLDHVIERGLKHMAWIEIEQCFRNIPSFTDERRVQSCTPDFWVVDSCDGLLLIELDANSFSDRITRLLVCNPVTRDYELLPGPAGSAPDLVGTCHWVLMYDSRDKRYKIVGITRNNTMSDGVGGGRRCYVFELGGQRCCGGSGDSPSWMELLPTVPSSEGSVQTALFREGKLHWLIIEIEEGRRSIKTTLLSMDIATRELLSTEVSPSLPSGQSRTDLWHASADGAFRYQIPVSGAITVSKCGF
ncbi:hypothetical protein CDL15_Pgr028734 [Punica granatum]|uniref:F-box domain-containing protein n=1 Tax=Punica granatum TaxID=22663 RepID=A0A218VX74_PUNGR|nr:hypothetical protein CDL15_Pgr028734 [Punica granatum]